MSRSAVVVGSGIVGASIAWHLAKAGLSVTVLDGGEPGGLATARSFAWINASWGNPEFYFHFRRRSMRRWAGLAQEVPGLGVRFCGGLIWDLPPDRLEAYALEHGRWGYGMRRVDRAGALAVEPRLKTPPDFALHVAEEGAVEPVAAARALLGHAGIVPRRVRVENLEADGGRIARLRTEAGTLEADEVVLAAGADTARLLGSAGVGLSMDTPAGLIAHSAPASARLLDGLVLTPDFHVRQTAQGRLTVGSDFAGSDPGAFERQEGEALMAKARAAIAGAEGLELAFTTLGHRPTPADGFPAIGRPAGLENLYVAVMHSGVTLAPLAGQLCAQEIATGSRDDTLAPFDPNRAALAG